jgi:hypothetical protein
MHHATFSLDGGSQTIPESAVSDGFCGEFPLSCTLQSRLDAFLRQRAVLMLDGFLDHTLFDVCCTAGCNLRCNLHSILRCTSSASLRGAVRCALRCTLRYLAYAVMHAILHAVQI